MSLPYIATTAHDRLQLRQPDQHTELDEARNCGEGKLWCSVLRQAIWQLDQVLSMKQQSADSLALLWDLIGFFDYHGTSNLPMICEVLGLERVALDERMRKRVERAHEIIHANRGLRARRVNSSKRFANGQRAYSRRR